MKFLLYVPRLDFLETFRWLTSLCMKIFAIASPYADLPTELIEKVSGSGFAMVSKWCPQQMILGHSVRPYYTVVITSDSHFW
jgi:hypothetical protein